MYIIKNSYADKILVALCFSGEFPYNSLEMIDKNKQMLQRNARKLKAESYIGITGKGYDKTMRLKQKGRDVIKDRYPELYEHYLMITDNGVIRTGKSNEASLWRSHRLAEMLFILQKSGVYFLHTHKPTINNHHIDEAVTLPPNLGFFYSSKEMKSVDEIARYKVSFTRILGMLACKEHKYALYNTNEGLMKWNNQGENKAQKMMEDIINKSFYQEERYYVTSSILFAKSMDVAYKVLNSNRGKKDSKGFEFLSFDNTFPNMHFITLDPYGIFQIKMLMLDDWKERLSLALFDKSEISEHPSSFDSDAFNKETNTIKVEFISGNIGKLKRAVLASKFNRGSTIEVFALPHQVEFLEKYLPEEFKVKIVNVGDLYSKILY